MAVQMPGYPSQDATNIDTASDDVAIAIPSRRGKWYFTRQELEFYSPSRKDGIEVEHESELRRLYCSFIQELGIELKVPQVTIATSMMLCHRFFTRQSHAKNDWQTIATVCVFLACKAKETPRLLCDVTVVAYKLMFKWDPSAPKRIRQKDVYEKQKELILIGERMLLSTIAYDLNIELPYKPLVAALKSLNISNRELSKVAWNFVNDWLRTTMCVQYKPHYIAAGSIYLAAKLQKVKLPNDMGKVWWMQFDVAPRQLEEVIQEMLKYLDKKKKGSTPKPKVSQQNVTKSYKGLGKSGPSNSSECGSAYSTVEDGDCEPKPGDSNPVVKLDLNKIKEAMKRKRQNKKIVKKIIIKGTDDDEIDSETWIEMELENGIEINLVTAN